MQIKKSQRIKRQKVSPKNRNLKLERKLRRRWRSWLPAMITHMGELLESREIFLGLQEIARNNPKILDPGDFVDWMYNNYITHLTVGARKFTDRDNRSQSLGTMLSQILEHPEAINLRAYKTLYSSRMIEYSDKHFYHLIGCRKENLSKSLIRSDIRRIKEATKRVHKFVNKRVAHFNSPGKIRRLPTFDELYGVLDTLNELLCKYDCLLNGSGEETTYETPTYNWKEVLYEPWIKEDFLK